MEECQENNLEITICSWYRISRDQRFKEVKRGLGLEGTREYEKRGCYRCRGTDLSCEHYIDYHIEYNKED